MYLGVSVDIAGKLTLLQACVFIEDAIHVSTCIYYLPNRILSRSCTINIMMYKTFKGTASIKMHDIDPSHMKETSFTCLIVIN